MSDSETEPESDVSSSPKKNYPDQVELLVAHAANSESSDPISKVDLAVKVLESLDFSLIRKDTSLHGAIQESSTTLLQFLHLVLTISKTSPLDVRRVIKSLVHILRTSFLNLMFQYRRLFHAIAVQELKTIVAVPIVISWVDAVLAKLGDVASSVASAMHDHYLNDDLPEALKKLRDEDNLRAAAQLPDSWDSIPSILTSEKASSAAKRLAVRLLVSHHVLQPHLIECSFDSFIIPKPDRNDSMVSMLPYLAGFLQHMVVQLSDFSPLHAKHQSGFQERMNCAMLLSLFALVDLTTRAKDVESGTPFRPHTLATVMRLLRFAMLVDNAPSAQTVVSPSPDLDAPQVVLVLWRHFIPWTWRLLAECNGSDTDTIISLTTTWLYYVLDSDPQTVYRLATLTDVEHGRYIVCAYLAYFSRLLVYLSSAPRPRRLTAAQTDVLLKICQYLVHLSDSDLLGIRKSSDCCRSFVLLFVYLSRLENAHDASEYVIHVMARMQPRTLREGWKQVIQEDASNVYDELEKSMCNTRMRLLEDKPGKNHVRRAKQFLDFWTIECFSNVQISNLKIIIEFLEATMEYLRRESAAERLTSLSTSFLSCLTAFQREQPVIRVCDAPLLSDPEIIWQVALDNATPDLALASSFALYIISTQRVPESLTQVEAWDFLRDVLLLIGSHDYLGEESPLALVVNPTICDALSHVVRHADEHAAVVMQSSPWTSHLQSVLGRIQSCDDCLVLGNYSSWLKKRVSKPATNLMNEIMARSDSRELKQATPPPIDILPCRINGIFHLVCRMLYKASHPNSRNGTSLAAYLFTTYHHHHYHQHRLLGSHHRQRRRRDLSSMSSPYYHRRSHSASSPSPSPVSKIIWHPASKRARSSHHNSLASPNPVSPNFDLWRTGKRLRRDISPPTITYTTASSTPASTDSYSSRFISSAPHTPLFPATPADFLLFPTRASRRENTSNNSRSKSTNIFAVCDTHSDFSRVDAARLRSDAFWELRRSVSENGEGLVKRMRDFEDLRSKSGLYSRARAVHRRRAKKRHSPSLPVIRSVRRSNSSESDDDDDVQIYSGELCGLPILCQKRASSLGPMDMDNNEMRGESASSFSECADQSSVYSSFFNDDPNDISHNSFNTTLPSDALPSASSSPAYKYSAYTSAFSPVSSGHSTNSPAPSLEASLPCPTKDTSFFGAPSSHLTATSLAFSQGNTTLTSSTSRTEKAIAALSLAMANGAGGLSDYEALRDLDFSPVMEAGELWH